MTRNRALNTCLRVLSDGKRRDVVSRLTNYREVRVGKRDNEETIELGHVHLPKMADEGYIDYEERSGGFHIERGPQWMDIADVFEAIQDSRLYE